jgi:protein SCO1/2
VSVRALSLAAALASASPAFAQERPTLLRDVGFDQRLDQTVPGDITLRDEAGREVRLRDYYGRRPLVIALVYYECPMLCTMTLNGLVSAMNAIPFDAGREYDVVTVSFEPRETPELAAAKKAAYLKRYARPGGEAGWHFLTGEPADLARLTSALGFRYAWDEERRQYAHPSGVVVLTPDGRIARYLFGIEYAPKDLRFALVEASEGRVGGLVDQAVLYCYQYDPMTGRYGAAIMRILRVAALLTLGALGTFIFVMWRRERAARRDPAPGSASA